MTLLSYDDPRHGTYNAYRNYGCRCDACRVANTKYHRDRGTGGYAKDVCECGGLKYPRSLVCLSCRRASLVPDHGTESRYTGYGCRCQFCKDASSAGRRRRRAAH